MKPPQPYVTEKSSFKVVCTDCGSLSIRIDSASSSTEALLEFGRCSAVRGTLGDLHVLARGSKDALGPPSREVLINLDHILMVQAGQGSGSAILFGREHLVTVEEDVPTVIRRIQTGPYVQTSLPSTPNQ